MLWLNPVRAEQAWGPSLGQRHLGYATALGQSHQHGLFDCGQSVFGAAAMRTGYIMC